MVRVSREDAIKIRIVNLREECVYGKQIRIMEVIQLLQRKPSDVGDIMGHIGKSERTVYRYLNQLLDLGMELKINEKRKYYLSECPICKSQNH